jgi:hypothetical protein
MTAAWLCMGRLCERVCRSEGGANDEEEWSCIDAPKGGKGGKGLMEKLSVEQNRRTWAYGFVEGSQCAVCFRTLSFWLHHNKPRM